MATDATRLSRFVRRGLRALWQTEPWAWLTPATNDNWGSHIPVLLGLSILLSPRRVVEFGSGEFSTRLFADDRYFPTVDHLCSIEHDPAWYANVLGTTALGPGDEIRLVDSAPQWIRDSDVPLGGLILIDNGPTLKERTAAIAATCERAEDDAVIVIHDFEKRSFRHAVPRSWPFVTVRAWRPMTGLVCRDEARLDEFSRLSRLIRAHRHIPPSESETWFQILQRLL